MLFTRDNCIIFILVFYFRPDVLAREQSCPFDEAVDRLDEVRRSELVDLELQFVDSELQLVDLELQLVEPEDTDCEQVLRAASDV